MFCAAVCSLYSPSRSDAPDRCSAVPELAGVAFEIIFYLSGDKEERGIRRDKAFWTVVLPLVNRVKKHPGWKAFHKEPSWTARRKDLEAQAGKEIEKIMGPHIGFYAAKKGGVSAFFSTLKGQASSPAHANCPPLQPGKAIIDNGGTKLDATQKAARQVARQQVCCVEFSLFLLHSCIQLRAH